MKIGTCIRGNHIFEDLEHAIKLGFDTVELYFNETLGGIDFTVILWQVSRRGRN